MFFMNSLEYYILTTDFNGSISEVISHFLASFFFHDYFFWVFILFRYDST